MYYLERKILGSFIFKEINWLVSCNLIILRIFYIERRGEILFLYIDMYFRYRFVLECLEGF